MTAGPEVLEPEVEALLGAGRSAVERGEPVPARFLIPTDRGPWQVSCPDLLLAGENDFGIPPRAFAYGAVGMLVAALGAERCMATEPAMAAPAPAGGRPPQAIVVTTFARGRLEVAVQPFQRHEEGSVAWGMPSVRSTGEPGPLGHAIPLWRAVNREPSPLPSPDGLIEDMTASGFCIERPEGLARP